MANLGLLFYKEYYASLGKDGFPKPEKGEKSDVEKINEQIFGFRFDNKTHYKKSAVATETFLMRTAYPGLLIGTGNAHGTSYDDNDIKVGFSFDYTTGLPVIPGSSVKGALRSHFKDHPDTVADVLDTDVKTVKELESEIFDGEDIFLDAVIYDGDNDRHILGDDYITPHDDATKNPVPVHIIKIMPDVRFEFRFVLKNGKLMTAEDKKELFVYLLEHFGVGAKTNVGYGILAEDETNGRIGQKNETTGNDAPRGNNFRDDEKRQKVQLTDAQLAETVLCEKCLRRYKKYNPFTGQLNKSCYLKGCK